MEQGETKASQSEETRAAGAHAIGYDLWNRYSTGRLVKELNGYNESRLFRSLIGDEDCSTISDVGCATGRFYRFFRQTWPSLEYKGFDVSEAAIDQATKAYPAGNFRVYNGDLKTVSETRSDIVFCRDVVLHQHNPIEFLTDLYAAAKKYLILRVRTREVGPTVFDVGQSCIYSYGYWVPYIVINTLELTDLIRSFEPSPVKITLWRHLEVLGGRHGRFLPKELYYPETGTAETALLVEKPLVPGDGQTVLEQETRLETPFRPMLRRTLGMLARRLGV